MLCRQYQTADFDESAALFVKVFASSPWNEYWTQTNACEYLGEYAANPAFFGFVGTNDAQITAVCFGHRRSWITGAEFHIDEMFVSPEMQHCGLGSTLMEYVVSDCRRKSFTTITLLTARHSFAEQFYRKNGFIESEKMIFMSLKTL